MKYEFRDWTTFDLLVRRYLDADFEDGETWGDLNRELSARGFPTPLRLFAQAALFPALAWNVVWWEWLGFGWRDVVVGYLSSLFVAAIIFGFFNWRLSLGLLGFDIVGFSILYGLNTCVGRRE